MHRYLPASASPVLRLKVLYTKAQLLYFILLWVSTQGFFVALEPVLELALVNQAGLELTKIPLPLPPEYWD